MILRSSKDLGFSPPHSRSQIVLLICSGLVSLNKAALLAILVTVGAVLYLVIFWKRL